MKEDLLNFDSITFGLKIIGAIGSIFSVSILQVTTTVGTFDFFNWQYFIFGALGQGAVSIFVYREYLTNHQKFKDRYINGNGWRLAIVESLSGGIAGFLLTGFIYSIISLVKINDFNISIYLNAQFVSVIIGILSEWFLQYRSIAHEKTKKILEEDEKTEN